MNRTLLYTVQRVLEKLNLDPVNSIADSEDALLISREAETTFYDMMTRAEWKQNLELLKLDSVSDLFQPTVLYLPAHVHKVSSVRYDCTELNKNKDIRTIKFLEPEEFLDRSYCLNSDKDNVVQMLVNGVMVMIEDDKHPRYYTSFDNEFLVFDSYNKEISDTILAANTICYGEIVEPWLEEDTFVIPLQDNIYPLYLASLSAACSMYMNSEVSQEDERRAARGISRMRREQIRSELDYFPKFKYGRRGNGLA